MTTDAEGEGLRALTTTRCAIVVADLVESVRLMQAHEAIVIDRWRRFVSQVRTAILPAHQGQMVKSLGDGLLLKFPTAPQAAAAATELHRCMSQLGVGQAADAGMYLRIGVHVADVVVDDLDMYGQGVNLTARICSLAGPGETVASADFRHDLVDGLDPSAEDLGEHELKNLRSPVHVFRLGKPDVAPALPGFDTFWLERPSIAVLPLLTSAQDAEAGVLAEVLADQLIHELAHTGAWRVISRLSTVAFRGRSPDVAEITRHLKVTWIITGRCLVHGSKLRLSIEMTDVRTASVIWSDVLEGDKEDVLRAEGSLGSRCIERLLHATFDHELQRSQSSPLPTLSSHTLLFAAIALMHRMSRQDFMRGQPLLEQLRERHPRAPEPNAWYAKWHVMRVVQGWSNDPDADTRAGRTCAQRALHERSNHSLGLAVDGLILGLLHKDLAGSQERYEAAIAANPNEALAWLFQSALYAYTDRGEEAARAAEEALSLSPLDPIRYFYDSFAAHAMLAAGRTDDAVRFAERSLRSNSSHIPTYRTLAVAQVLAGREAEAQRTVKRLLTVAPDYNVSQFLRRYPGSDSQLARRSAEALSLAGLPAD